ncbi:hypothetical protein [Gluconacetobacter sp.]|uniref:hypothetical protein n=1 Tax=Gluconacetobacter sp. TaxID=1935994 RepID=UPI0039ECD55D
MKYALILNILFLLIFSLNEKAFSEGISVQALTSDGPWVVYQSYNDVLLDNRITDVNCNIQKTTDKQTINISTSPTRAISHAWLLTLREDEMEDRTGEILSVHIKTGVDDVDKILEKQPFSAIQRLHILRITLTDDLISKVVSGLRKSGKILLETDRETFSVNGEGFLTDINRYEFAYCLAQDISKKPQWYSITPPGLN